ncbi:MAG TPA: Ppx/GppA phosphatase family protein [Candidatus Methylacidiphilales bacterium]|jgi:exopolyphosphatase/guanosine-5'-triphosphate,3'-diphosphate pyrophosphatase|nr:Ppx/GppA phosphatase family protein [Candidatus Methylacidiphilales bacterium]
MRYAVFDLGSNSIKCVMAETRARGVRILHEESISTRLAEHLIDTAELRPEAITRTLEALRKLRATAALLGIQHFRAVATSAVRDSRNRREFLRAARAVLGFPVRLLSGDEEAETIFAGVLADPHWRGKDIFILDIGGGSAEWVQGRHGKMEKRTSLPLGAVRLRERFLHEYPVAPDTAALLVETIRGQIAHPLHHYSLGPRRLVGTGGTITSLAAIEHKLPHFDPQKIDHTPLSIAQVRRLFRNFCGRTLEELRALPGLPRKRADLIIPGTAVVLATMELLGAKRIHVSVRGLRYGVLTAAIHESEPRSPSPVPARHLAKLRKMA